MGSAVFLRILVQEIWNWDNFAPPQFLIQNENIHNFCLNNADYFIFSQKQDINENILFWVFHGHMTSHWQMRSDIRFWRVIIYYIFDVNGVIGTYGPISRHIIMKLTEKFYIVNILLLYKKSSLHHSSKIYVYFHFVEKLGGGLNYPHFISLKLLIVEKRQTLV